MSKHKKKLRNPSPEAVAKLEQERQERLAKERADREAQQRAQPEAPKPEATATRADTAWMNELSPEEHKFWCDSGERLYARLTGTLPVPEGAMTREEVADSLETCTRFLTRLADTATAILECLDPNSLRKIIAADVPLSEQARTMLKAIGYDFYEQVESPAVEQPKDSSPQKRPRGSRHPLMAFFSLAVQASRLVKDITRAVWPHVHNQRTLDEKEAIRQARQGDAMTAMEGMAMMDRISRTT